ncbi:MAG: AMP-binding protein [Spirochaetota bacterium]|nr:AMP-binding protein [Spirochaetota bacterium]
MSIPGLADNLGSLLETAAARYGDKKALHFEYDDSSLTFRQIHENVNRYANALAGAGVKNHDHVAVMLPNIPDFPLVWLALARIGAVMVPLNIRYQPGDLEYVLNDSDASAVVIFSEFLPVLDKVRAKCPGIRTVFSIGESKGREVTRLDEAARTSSDTFKGPQIGRDQLMNIQYTSGTTGFPKGCMLTHEYWLTLAWVTSQSSFTITGEDVFLSVQSFFYMDPQWQLAMALTIGCTMILARRYSASGFMPLVHRHNVTCSLAEAAQLIFGTPEKPDDGQHKLRFVLIFGFPSKLHKKFEERFNVAAREAYGMTEIGACTIVPLEDAHMTGSGSVGKPLPYRELRIVDDEGREVPPGTPGELLVKGPGLFKGYYKKKEATEAAFDGEWFRTGDLFIRDPDGYHYVAGRKKDMVRRAGENISCAEVEYILESHPKLLRVAVVPVPDDLTGEEVKAYVITREGESKDTIGPGEIIEYGLKHLAKFKVPRYIEYRDSFPMTPNMRVEKHKLIAEKQDLTVGSYDAKLNKWR